MNQFDEITPPAPVIDDGIGLMGELELMDGDLCEKADSNQPYAQWVKDSIDSRW